MTDLELWLRGMLILSGICLVIAAATVIAGTIFLLKAYQFLRRTTRRPEILRDHEGRPFRERL